MSKTQVWKNLGPSAALSCGCLDLVPAGAGMGWGWGFWPSEAHLEVSRGSEGRRWSLLKNAASWPAEAPGGALCPLQAGAPGAAFLCLWADGDLSTCEAFCTQRLLQGVSSSCPPLKHQCRERLVVLERKVCFVLGAGVAEGGQTPVQRPIPPPPLTIREQELLQEGSGGHRWREGPCTGQHSLLPQSSWQSATRGSDQRHGDGFKYS